MPDTAQPISTTVPETVSVDTGADQESVTSLNKAFADFWGEQDAGAATSTSPPPAAPGEQTGAAQETRKGVRTPLDEKPADTTPLKTETPPAAKAQTTPEVTPAASAPPTQKEISDDEIERMELSPHARPDHQKDFKYLKECWKADRLRLKAEAQRTAQLENDLVQARQGALSPEQRQDYEHAAAIRRQFSFQSDPGFINQYQLPIRNQYHALLDEAVEALPDKEAAKQWADHIKANYQPEQLDRAWWLNSVIAKVPSEIERQSLMGGMSNLLKLQRDRDAVLVESTKDENSYQAWQMRNINAQAEHTRNEIMAEIGVQEKRIQEVLPRDINQAKTNEEREAIAKHNERFTKLNDYFKGVIQDLASNGPRAWVRAGVEATRTMILLEENDDLVKELKDIKAERDSLKGELEKITGARRKLASTSGTGPSVSPSVSQRNGQGLSIRNLDVRDAFKRYDWGEGGT